MNPTSNLPPPPITYRLMQAVISPVFKAFGLSCRSAFNLCNEQMDRDLTKSESIRLRVHLSMCGLCRHLPAQFRGLRSLIQACEHDHSHDETSHETMPAEAKLRIAECLKSQQKS